jgi:ribosomal protein L11 methyltransferase
MIESLSRDKATPSYRPPYDELFIYYIEGRVPEQVLVGTPTFIGTWEEDGFSFVFFSAEAEKSVGALLQAYPHLSLIDRFQMPYDDWQGGRVAAFRAGCFYVKPPWESGSNTVSAVFEPKVVGEIPLWLDPGVVFGTGTHPTTRDCLAALEILYREAAIDRVLDLGTGTGILAVAAAGLGSAQVLAVDFNRLAVKTAQHNIQLNGFEKQVLPVHGRAEELVDCPAELLMANIHFEVMKTVLTSPGFKAKRHWILSGLLRSEAREAESLLIHGGGRIIKRWTRDNIWYTYLGHHARR